MSALSLQVKAAFFWNTERNGAEGAGVLCEAGLSFCFLAQAGSPEGKTQPHPPNQALPACLPTREPDALELEGGRGSARSQGSQTSLGVELCGQGGTGLWSPIPQAATPPPGSPSCGSEGRVESAGTRRSGTMGSKSSCLPRVTAARLPGRALTPTHRAQARPAPGLVPVSGLCTAGIGTRSLEEWQGGCAILRCVCTSVLQKALLIPTWEVYEGRVSAAQTGKQR